MMLLPGLHLPSHTISNDVATGKSQSGNTGTIQTISFGEVMEFKERQLQQVQVSGMSTPTEAWAFMQTLSLGVPLTDPQPDSVQAASPLEEEETAIPVSSESSLVTVNQLIKIDQPLISQPIKEVIASDELPASVPVTSSLSLNTRTSHQQPVKNLLSGTDSSTGRHAPGADDTRYAEFGEGRIDPHLTKHVKNSSTSSLESSVATAGRIKFDDVGSSVPAKLDILSASSTGVDKDNESEKLISPYAAKIDRSEEKETSLAGKVVVTRPLNTSPTNRLVTSINDYETKQLKGNSVISDAELITVLETDQSINPISKGKPADSEKQIIVPMTGTSGMTLDSLDHPGTEDEHQRDINHSAFRNVSQGANLSSDQASVSVSNHENAVLERQVETSSSEFPNLILDEDFNEVRSAAENPVFPVAIDFESDIEQPVNSQRVYLKTELDELANSVPKIAEAKQSEDKRQAVSPVNLQNSQSEFQASEVNKFSVPTPQNVENMNEAALLKSQKHLAMETKTVSEKGGEAPSDVNYKMDGNTTSSLDRNNKSIVNHAVTAGEPEPVGESVGTISSKNDLAVSGLFKIDRDKETKLDLKIRQPLKVKALSSAEGQPELDQMVGHVPLAKGLADASVLQPNPNVLSGQVNGRVADMVQQVINHFNTSIKDGTTSIHLQLNPEELGAIDVHMLSSSQGVLVSFFAEQPGTGKLLESQLDQLRVLLQNSGIQLSGLNISQHNQFGQKGGAFEKGPNPGKFSSGGFRQSVTGRKISHVEKRFGLTSEIDYLI